MSPRKNPKIGKHPDLYAKTRVSATQIDEMPDDTDVVVEDWRMCSPDDLRRAATNGELTEDDYAEMEGYEEQADADGDVSALLADGLSRALARAIVGVNRADVDPSKRSDTGWGKKGWGDNASRLTLRAELMDLDEKSREARAKPFIEYMRSSMWGSLEYECGDREGENVGETYVDMFQSDLEETSITALQKAAREVLGDDDLDFEKYDEGALEEILRDPGNFDVKRHSGYRNVSGSVWSAKCNDQYDERDGTKYEDQLEKILHGGEYKHHSWGQRGDAYDAGERDRVVLDALPGGTAHVEIYPGLGQEDLDYALKDLENEEPYVTVATRGKRRRGLKDSDPITVDDFDGGYTLHSSFYDDEHIVASYNEEKLRAALSELGEIAPPSTGPEHDDVVYTYAGTNDSVAGASGRGLYVAKLKANAKGKRGDLQRESTVLGHCIGNEANGHPDALRRGQTQVYSIRTEAGKPKFTIELRRVDISVGQAESVRNGGWEAGGILDETNETKPCLWTIAEVKGKANRLAGFEAGGDREGGKGFTKPDDLRLVTDFLLHLGFSPQDCKEARDIAPGITAMIEAGGDPFAPPPRKAPRPHRDPRQQPKPNPTRTAVSARVERLLARTKPMGTFRR